MSGSPEEVISERLLAIERQHQVTILYACESGSRAWGFPSRNSDYDVRFVYVQERDWYLSVEQRRDVIELPIEDDFDINGWDLRKALQLFRKSNPPLLEWLKSPIVYLERGPVAGRLRSLAEEHYSARACMYHYLHMARGNFREFLRGPEVRLKKYLYVLRPLLALRWLERDMGMVPTEFQILVEAVTDSDELRTSIGQLLERKRSGEEMDAAPPIAPISQFIEDELERLEGGFGDAPQGRVPLEPLNDLLRMAVAETASVS